MRRFFALSRSAALQALAEPLSAVMFLVSVLAIHLAPVFHYHRFGEVGRLARECGFSSLLCFGLIFATAAAVRAIGGEIASGTAAGALSRPVSRPLFFVARIAGVAATLGLFLVAVAAATLLSVQTCETGEALLVDGEPVRIWRVTLGAGVGFALGAFAVAAVANRFFRSRFCVTACLLMAVGQCAGLAASCLAHPLSPWAWRILPALAALFCGCLVFVTAAGALSVRLKPAAVTAGTALAVVASFLLETISSRCSALGAVLGAIVPDISRFWLVDALADGAVPAAGAVVGACVVAGLLVCAWAAIGSALLCGREIP